MVIKSVPAWTHSAKGRPIDLFQYEVSGTSPILFMGGVHGDEPEGVALAEATLSWLKRDSEREKKVTTSWILIPCLNPDGYKENNRVNGNGVDLNRNYPSRDWSPSYEKERYFPGPRPGSEPEIKALVELIRVQKPRLIIHCHSWNPCIVYTGEPGLAAAQALGECSGYEVRTEIGYPTPGSLSRYGWHDNQIPVICIEEKEGTHPAEVWPHFSKAIQEIFTNVKLLPSSGHFK